ncbi:MAG: MnhB domain-containing protein, partial [bacterium]|nr:MnhB domain-containing protein [bacterium]
FLIISVVVLLRGHSAPGGGFIGGLLAAAGFILYAIGFDVKAARQKLNFNAVNLIGAGLLLSLLSGLLSIYRGAPFSTIEFFTLKIASNVSYAISTPLFFDIGVFLVVVGVLLTVVFSLMEEQ